MSLINMPRDERDAIDEINVDILRKLVEQCLRDERPDALQSLRLQSCGLYVASRLREFKDALSELRAAKSAKKRADTETDASRSARNLIDAVLQMKHRAEVEDTEEQRFYIEDHIPWPLRFSERMSVHVRYRWRKEIGDEWTHGSIIFTHKVDTQPEYRTPMPSRKPGPAKIEQDRQRKLSHEWEHLIRLCLESVKEYFREGGDGATIPQTYQAKVDPRTRELNNFSAEFWRQQP